jgi:hypothetical protein
MALCTCIHNPSRSFIAVFFKVSFLSIPGLRPEYYIRERNFLKRSALSTPYTAICPLVSRLDIQTLILRIKLSQAPVYKHHSAIFFRLFVEYHDEARIDALPGLLVLTYRVCERKHLGVGSAVEPCFHSSSNYRQL